MRGDYEGSTKLQDARSGNRRQRRGRAALTMLAWCCVCGTVTPATAADVSNNKAAAKAIDQALKEQTPEGPHDWLVKHPTILRLLELHNAERARYGMPALMLDTSMCLAAQRHAVWMASYGGFQHSGMGYRENIYHGVTTPEAAVQGWIYSPSHHSNLLSGYRVGFGYTLINGRPYWVAVFQ